MPRNYSDWLKRKSYLSKILELNISYTDKITSRFGLNTAQEYIYDLYCQR